MSHLNTVSAGTTADQALLDQFEKAHHQNFVAEYATRDNHGVSGFFNKVLGGTGGTAIGMLGMTAAMAMTNVQGTIMTNPVVAATLAVGALVGAAAGVVLFSKADKEENEWHAHTSEHVNAVEQQALARPDLADRLQARRELAAAKATHEINADNDKKTKIYGGAFLFGAMTGGS